MIFPRRNFRVAWHASVLLLLCFRFASFMLVSWQCVPFPRHHGSDHLRAQIGPGAPPGVSVSNCFRSASVFQQPVEAVARWAGWWLGRDIRRTGPVGSEFAGYRMSESQSPSPFRVRVSASEFPCPDFLFPAHFRVRVSVFSVCFRFASVLLPFCFRYAGET